MTARKPAPPDMPGSTDADQRSELFNDFFEAPDDENVQTVINELGLSDGQSAKMFVYLLDPEANGKEVRVWDGPPEDYDLTRISRDFGSGEYRVKLYAPQPGGGPRVVRGSTLVRIKLTTADERALKAARSTAPADNTTGAPAFNMVDVARMISEGIRAAMPPPAVTPAPVNPLTQLRDMAEIMATLTPKQPAQGGGLGQLRDLVEVAKLLNPGSSEGGAGRQVNASGMDLLETLIDKFAPAIAGAVMGKMPAMPDGVAPPPGLPAPDAIQTTQAIQPTQPEVVAMPNVTQIQSPEEVAFINGVSFLLNFARMKVPTDTYAGLVIDSVPPETLAEFLKQTDAEVVEGIAKQVPDVRNHVEWFTQLIADVREMTTPEPEQVPAPPAA